ncbi:hypothetical protein IRY61_03195 [Candidatus Saccharibacteria bacterium]|nr:hypothetical protein [Candidatus Saccharibacteria bacterium]
MAAMTRGGVEIAAEVPDGDHTAILDVLQEWIAIHHWAHGRRQPLLYPESLDIAPLDVLMRECVDHPFDGTTVDVYLRCMQYVEAIETGVSRQGELSWILLHGATGPLDGETASDEWPYAVVTLSGHATVKASAVQVAVAPMQFDEEVGLLVPRERVLVSTGPELHGPKADRLGHLAVLSLARAVYDVLPK